MLGLLTMTKRGLCLVRLPVFALYCARLLRLSVNSHV